jgi:nicotinamidase-related amidase
MLQRNSTALILIDIQGKLATLVHEREQLFANLQILIRGARALQLPVLWLEQYPRGLGPTIPEVADLLPELVPLAKTCFSACGLPEFTARLGRAQRRQLLLAGIETHVCVYQTARDLLAAGYHVEVVADAVSSRTAPNRRIGLERLQAAGASVTSVEMALFELVRDASDPQFKTVAALVK